MTPTLPAGGTGDYLPVFSYGTLCDPDVLESLVGPVVRERIPARARGRRHTVAAAYPAVSFPAGGADGEEEVAGELIWLDRDTMAASLAALDAYEGTPVLFRRVRVDARTDRGRMPAWAYEWAGG